jgi:probable F420-dependent oxidoreductase
MKTSRVRLATGVLIAPLRPAPLLAKTIATLDTISSGRIDLGVGTGWQPEEYDAMGLSFDERAQRLDDTIAACRVLWSNMPASYTSTHTTFTDTYCAPQPVQERLPIWFAGALTKRNLARIVDLGDGWIPIMGATLDDIRAGATLINETAKRPIVVQAPLPMVVSDDGSRDPIASMTHAPSLVEAGVTDIYLNIAAFAASPADAPAAVETIVSSFREALA